MFSNHIKERITLISKIAGLLDPEVLCCQASIVDLQHESGIVLCGDADLKKKEGRRQRAPSVASHPLV